MPLTRRSCPHCGARGIIGAWWAPFGWPMRWDCPSCSRPLKFSGRRALVLALLRAPLTAVYVYAIFAQVWWVAVGAAVLAIVAGGMEMVEGVRSPQPGRPVT